MTTELDTLRAQLAEAEEDCRNMGAIMVEMGAHPGSHNTGEKAMMEVKGIWESLKADVARLTDELEQARTERDLARVGLAARRKDNDQLRTELEQARKERNDWQKRYAIYSEKHDLACKAGSDALFERDQLRADNARLQAQYEAMRGALEMQLFIAENADETGYVTDVGFIDVDKEREKARAALSSDPGSKLLEEKP